MLLCREELVRAVRILLWLIVSNALERSNDTATVRWFGLVKAHDHLVCEWKKGGGGGAGGTEAVLCG